MEVVGVAPNDICTGCANPWGKCPIATAKVQDAFPGLGFKQGEDFVRRVRDKAAIFGRSSRIPGLLLFVRVWCAAHG